MKRFISVAFIASENLPRMWFKIPDRIELGPARRDWFSKNRRDLSHNRRKGQDRLNHKFMLYWLLYIVFVRRRNLEILGDPARLPRSYTCPTFPSSTNIYSLGIYYLFSLSTSSYLYSLMIFKNLLQSRSIISSIRGSHVLHFWNKTFNIIRVNSSHLISLYESINAAT